MKLYINSIKDNSTKIEVKLIESGQVVKEESRSAQYEQSEKLLPLIEKVISQSGRTISDIKEIEVENKGGTFTSVRIGIVVANALGYAWGVPVTGTVTTGPEKPVNGYSIVRPVYDQEPNITL